MGDLLIDVSKFQGKPDWKKAKGKLKGAYIRVGLRGSLAKTAPQDYKKIRFDKSWKYNLSGVQAYCIPFGVYFFPTAINDSEALEEAKWFYDQVKDLDMDYPPILDSENVWGTNKEPGRANSLSKAERTRLLKIITDYFNARGMNIGIYASASWFTSHLDMSKFPQCVIDCTWVADSTGAVDYKGYYWLHQYGKGKCDGFSGDVDLNKVCGKIPVVKTTSKPKEVKADPVDVLLQIAQSEVGYHEGPNNSNKYGDEMHSIQPKNMDRNAPWCLVANTMILTDGGYKPIEELCVGDAVLNASGSGFNRVTNIMSREHEVCSVKAYGSIDMKSTPDHPFLSKQRLGVRKDWKYSPLEYRPVSDLKKGDDVVTPVTTVLFSEDLSYDEAWAIGYFVGDGWKTSRNDYKLCGNSKKEELIYSHISSLRKDKDYKSRTCYEYTILVDKNQRIIPFLDEAGRGAENKVVPKSILFSRKETKSAFLDGYLSADGDKEGRFSTVSKKLALGISKLAFDLGYGCALWYQVRAENQKIYDDRIGKYRDIKIKPIIYIGKINKAEKKCNRLDRIDGTNVYVPIKSFENAGEISTVYNISVDGDNTYLANNIAVHNCDAFCDWCVLQMCKKFGYGADMARKVLCGDFDDYTYFSVNLYKKAGRWTSKPGRGYQIFFGGDGHTGWVESVDSKIHTIEGNKGDEVRRCSYSLNDSRIIGYGMPRYDLVKGTATVEEPTTVNRNDGILRRGSTGKAVRFIQLCLGGLDDDGSFGWKTLSAVVEFQKSHGLEADGEVGPLTFAAILKTMPLIRKGDKGRYVKALQVALGGLEVDGSFGPLTDAAVREFQKEHSLVVDGEVGKKTWAAIFKYCFC